ncbi:MAG TPA: sulfatase-like hydrolase/transferase [Pirellulales bacterium]
MCDVRCTGTPQPCEHVAMRHELAAQLLHRITTLIIAAATALGGNTPLKADNSTRSQCSPNIIIILADDLGYGELGCQGFTREIPTPHIDSIADNGVRFTNGYVSGPYCSPTRAGFMTGRYQTRFGHEFNPGPVQLAPKTFGLPLSETTIADRLKAAGYTTGWFGKSHLGYEPPFHPLKRGFEEFYGFLGGAHSYLNAMADRANPILRGTTPTADIDGYTTDAFAREAVKFIEHHKSSPWFCYLAFNAVHAPLEATDKYLVRFASIKDDKRRKYAAMQSAMDDAVGSVLGKIRELGLEENTLIFLFSDNGGPTAQTTSGNGPLRGFKAQTWEGGIHVPFMVQWKGHIPAGKIDDRPVIQLDIHPTALAAAGVAIAPEWKLDGVNLMPYLTGENTDAPHEALYWRFGSQVAIRKGDWKLVKGVGNAGVQGIERRAKASMEGAELYNLGKDIGEKMNLAEQQPSKVKELAADWDRWNSDNVDAKWVPTRRAGNRANQVD